MRYLRRVWRWPLACAAAVALAAGCSASPAASAPAAQSAQPPAAASAPSPTPVPVAMRPACAPPEAAVVGGSVLNTWAASAARRNTLAGSLTFDLRGGSVSSVLLVVGTPDAVSDPTELSRPASDRVLARVALAGPGAAGPAVYPFSLDYTPSRAGRLPVFALIRYTGGAACHGSDGVAAQPLGWIDVS